MPHYLLTEGGNGEVDKYLRCKLFLQDCLKFGDNCLF